VMVKEKTLSYHNTVMNNRKFKKKLDLRFLRFKLLVSVKPAGGGEAPEPRGGRPADEVPGGTVERLWRSEDRGT
jgi:hypothetical protein